MCTKKKQFCSCGFFFVLLSCLYTILFVWDTDISNTTNVNLRCPTATPVLNRCEAFGGAIGIGNSSNITNRTDDDDDDDDATSSAPRVVGSWILFVFTTIMATTTSWMVE